MLVPQTADVSTTTPVSRLLALQPDALEQLLGKPRRERFQRLDSRLRTQPRHLTLGQLTGRRDRLLARVRPIIPPLEVSPYLTIADRPHGRHVRIEVTA